MESANILPSYSNGALVQINGVKNVSYQQALKRERHRRMMINRMLLLFDEDGEFTLVKRTPHDDLLPL